MQIAEVTSRARVLLVAASRFAGAVDGNSIISVANENDPTVFGNPSRLRTESRALEFLVRSQLIDLAHGGYSYELTSLGRKFLQDGWQETLSADWLPEWVETEELLEALSQGRTASQNIVAQLTVHDWRQFSNIDIVFHDRLTILTGANGAGKTTLLNILGPHFNWAAQLLTRQRSNESVNSALEVGQIIYTNGGRSQIVQTPTSGIQNSPLAIPQLQQVPGIFINSHRSVSSYQPLTALPPRFSEPETLQQQFAAEIQVRYSGGSSQHSPLYRMKEALVAAAMFAYGNPAVRPSEAAREVWEGYQEVLRRFLPDSLQFMRFEVEDSEIIVVTESTEFPLEAVSGGISAMLELSWQIFLRQKNQASFTVCIDEPENHLHPELQRSIVPSLLRGFPNVSFIIATHSPFVVTSADDSNVYALGADESGKITSRLVSDVNRSATPDETLMSVLGLDTALPLWAESELSKVMENFPASPSTEDLRNLKKRMKEIGLDRQFPAAVRSLEVEQ